MKRFLAIAISAIFLLGFAASAFAIHAEIPSETQAVVAKGETQITLGGSIRVRGEYRDTNTYNEDAEESSSAERAIWDQRVRLWLDAKVSDNVKGFIMVENQDANDNDFDGTNTDTWVWGDSANSATGVYTKGNGKPADLWILEAWIEWKNDIANLKIGHMPLALGNLLFFDHRKFGDDAILVYKDINNLHLAALNAKLDENSIAVADDVNAYVALFAYKGDGFNVSGDVTWVNDNSNPLDLYNFGLRGDVKITDNVKIKGDIEIQTGDTTNDPTGTCSAADCDFGGWAALVGVEAKLDPVTLALELGSGSGDDNPSDGDIDIFITSLSSGIPYITFVHGTRSTNNAGFGAGITNITYLKGSVSGKPTAKMNAKADIVWLKSTEDYATGEDDIGWEIDGNVTYQLGKNLVYWVEGGYFFADSAYGDDDAYAIRHGIELTF